MFLACDGHDLSIAQVLQQLGVAFDKLARLLPVPMSWLNLVFTLLGEASYSQCPCGSLQVDIAKNQQLLGCGSDYVLKFTVSLSKDYL